MSALARYAEVLRPPGARTALAASTVGRVSLSSTGLGALLLTRDTTGSYAAAGAVSASYAISFALAAPGRARSADRVGPVRVLVRCGLLHPLALLALVLLAWQGAPALALAGAAVAAGVTVPPIGSVMRALWGDLAPASALQTAYSLESVVVELCFVVGPLLVAGLTALFDPAAPVLASAVLAAGGALWLASVPRLRAVEPHTDRPTSMAGPLVSAAVRAQLLTVLWIGVGFGAIEVAVPAFVEEHGSRPSAAGVVLAVWSLGSVLGGLVYGGLHPRARAHRQLPVLVAALAIGSVLPVLSPGVLLLCAALFAYGSTIAPFSACNSVLLGASAPAGTLTEAFAWNGSMIFGGAALGSALAGQLVGPYGAVAALAVTAAAGLLTLLSSVVGLSALRAGAAVSAAAAR